MKSLLEIKKEAMTYLLILAVCLSCLAIFIALKANPETVTNTSSQFANAEKSNEEKRFDIIERCYDKTMRSISPSAERAIQVRRHCSEIYKNSPEDIQTIK